MAKATDTRRTQDHTAAPRWTQRSHMLGAVLITSKPAQAHTRMHLPTRLTHMQTRAHTLCAIRGYGAYKIAWQRRRAYGRSLVTRVRARSSLHGQVEVRRADCGGTRHFGGSPRFHLPPCQEMHVCMASVKNGRAVGDERRSILAAVSSDA